jgi:plasmid stabilization system protein ParE
VTRPVRFRARAEAELLEACAWYDEQQAGRGDLFAAAVERTIDHIAATPEAYPRVDEETRRAIVRRYAYNVFFRVRPQQITILAIVHTSRHPDRWRSRS